MSQRKMITKEDIQREYLDKSVSQVEACRVLGCSTRILVGWLKAYNLPRKLHGWNRKRRNKYPQLQDRDWLVEQLKTKPAQQIAREIGTTSGNISDFMKRHGLREDKSVAYKHGWHKAFPQGKKAERGNNWQGGRKKRSQGYIAVYTPEHPYADGKGYVLEHRIIMEKHLGRYLEPGEIVHHINMVKTDNRIENLERMDSQSEHLAHHMFLTHFIKRHNRQKTEINTLKKEVETLKTLQQKTIKKVNRLIVDNQLRMFEEPHV